MTDSTRTYAPKRFVQTLVVDEYGDVFCPIPDEILDELGIDVTDWLEVSVEGETIVIKKVNSKSKFFFKWLKNRIRSKFAPTPPSVG